MCRRLTAVGTLCADLWTGPQDLRPGRHRGADLWQGRRSAAERRLWG